MRTSTPFRATASLMLCGLVLAACGQKAGVRVGDEGLAAGQVPAAQQGVATDGGAVQQGATDPTAGATTDPAAGGATANPTDAGTATDTAGTQPAAGEQQASGGEQQATGGEQQATGGEQQATGGEQTGGEQQATGGGQQAQILGNDRTGAPEDRIVIGLHAPATGAAPLPTTSFNEAKEVYWKWHIEKEGPVLGRERVEVLFKDDKYDPNSAGQVCKELASQAFLVGGGGGTDQIQRCGQLAAVGQFPYFSAGVTEAGLTDNDWYFAASMTYRQQGALLAQYIAKNPDNNPNFGSNAKIGTIITATENFDDALAGWEAGLKANGLTNTKTFRHTKNDDTWIAGVAREFSQAGINVVYFLSAPTLYLDFANQADSSFGFNPTYVGVGVSKGLNAVLNGGCKAPGKRDDNGIFLSPFPGLDQAPQEFKDASAAYGAPQDDIALALWGLAEGQHELFKRYADIYGNDLERATFRHFVENQAGAIETTVYPTVQYSAGGTGHFGANAAYVVEANCDIKQYETNTNGPVTGF